MAGPKVGSRKSAPGLLLVEVIPWKALPLGGEAELSMRSTLMENPVPPVLG